MRLSDSFRCRRAQEGGGVGGGEIIPSPRSNFRFLCVRIAFGNSNREPQLNVQILIRFTGSRAIFCDFPSLESHILVASGEPLSARLRLRRRRAKCRLAATTTASPCGDKRRAIGDRLSAVFRGSRSAKQYKKRPLVLRDGAHSASRYHPYSVSPGSDAALIRP